MYGVEWLDPAMNELAAIYAPADPEERERIMAAVRAIDGVLRVEGPEAGESRPEKYRIVLHPPLGILFTMDATSSVAGVEKVWWYAPGGIEPEGGR